MIFLKNKKCLSNIIFTFMWYMIGFISLVDLYLALSLFDLTNMEFIRQQEKNLIVVYLLELTNDLSLFTTCKILGTIISLFIIKKIYEKDKRVGTFICAGVFTFQACLLYYLFFGGVV